MMATPAVGPPGALTSMAPTSVLPSAATPPTAQGKHSFPAASCFAPVPTFSSELLYLRVTVTGALRIWARCSGGGSRSPVVRVCNRSRIPIVPCTLQSPSCSTVCAGATAVPEAALGGEDVVQRGAAQQAPATDSTESNARLMLPIVLGSVAAVVVLLGLAAVALFLLKRRRGGRRIGRDEKGKVRHCITHIILPYTDLRLRSERSI